MAYLNIFDQSFQPYTTDSSVSRVLNMYAEEGYKSQSQLKFLSVPGYELYTTLSGSVIRGMHEHKGLGYAVSSGNVYKITDDTTPTLEIIGTLTTSTGRVSIASINDEILFADGAKVWSYKVSTDTFAEVVDIDLPSSVEYICSHLGYFIAISPNTDTFWVSDLNDGTSWGALAFASAELNRDNLVAAVPLNQSVWMLGEISTELWYNSGSTAGAPYDRRSGGAQPIGCAAAHSALAVGESLLFLAQNDSGLLGVIKATESGFEIVSTRPMVEQFNSYNSVSDAFAWTYSKDSHIFYVLTFPDSTSNRGHTWQYDLTTGLWSELESINPITPLVEPYSRHTANAHMYVNRKHLIGDVYTGKIFHLKSDVYLQDEDNFVRELTSNIITQPTQKYITVDSVEIEVQQDIGTEDIDPVCILQVSKDKGQSWAIDLDSPAGVIGRTDRVIFHRLGSARSFIFKLIMTDAVNWSILGVKVEINGS